MSEPQRCLILSSGRCGSTLLSELIATEPETLSISEALIGRTEDGWKSDDKITGTAFWNLLSTPSRQWKTAVRIGAVDDEVRYPATGRWAGNLAELPPVAAVALPALSADPDSLFDLLAARVPDFPAQTLAQHYEMLFDLLASLHQRRRWVERSGASSAMAGPLLEKMRFDKVVYLTRDAAKTAASMSRHASFQFAVIRTDLLFRCGFDPYDDAARPGADGGGADGGGADGGGADGADRQVPAEMRCLLPENLTRATLAERGGRIEQHQLIWVGMSYRAETALARHPPRQLLRMRYEDLVAAPAEQLRRLAEFLGFADPAGWAARSAGRVRRAG